MDLVNDGAQVGPLWTRGIEKGIRLGCYLSGSNKLVWRSLGYHFTSLGLRSCQPIRPAGTMA
jgi:hypothetical protein